MQAGWTIWSCFALAILLFGSGCATSAVAVYDIQVKSTVGQTSVNGSSYRIVEQAVAPDQRALYEEMLATLRVALRVKGLKEAAQPDRPDLYLMIGTGVKRSSTEMEKVSEPVYVLVSGILRVEKVQTSTVNGVAQYETVIHQDPPSMQLVGYNDRRIPVDHFGKFLVVRATTIPPTLKEGRTNPSSPPAVWEVAAVWNSKDKDLKKVLPILSAACMVYAGKDSNGPVTIRMRERDADVLAIKQGR